MKMDQYIAEQKWNSIVNNDDEIKEPAPVTSQRQDLVILADQTSATATQLLEQLKLHSIAVIDEERRKLDDRARLEGKIQKIYDDYSALAKDTLTDIWNRCGYRPKTKFLATRGLTRSHDFATMREERGYNTTFCRVCDMPEKKGRQQVSALHLARTLIEKDIDAGLLILDEDEANYLELLWGRAYPSQDYSRPDDIVSFRDRLKVAVGKL